MGGAVTVLGPDVSASVLRPGIACPSRLESASTKPAGPTRFLSFKSSLFLPAANVTGSRMASGTGAWGPRNQCCQPVSPRRT